MRKLIVLFVFAFSLTSCVFTEEITIGPDGSGKYNLNMDGSSIMAMMPKDSMSSVKNVDSVFSFKKIFEAKKDSIAKLPLSDQEKLKKLEKFDIRMKMNHDSKEFLFSMATDFKAVSELQNVMNDLSELQAMNKGGEKKQNPMGDLGVFGGNGTKINYTYDGKKFTRKSIVDKEALKKISKDSLDTYKMVFEQSKYVIKYHFPKAVKKVSNPTALFSEDRKTITIEYSFMDYIKEPGKLNFEVEFAK